MTTLEARFASRVVPKAMAQLKKVPENNSLFSIFTNISDFLFLTLAYSSYFEKYI